MDAGSWENRRNQVLPKEFEACLISSDSLKSLIFLDSLMSLNLISSTLRIVNLNIFRASMEILQRSRAHRLQPHISSKTVRIINLVSISFFFFFHTIHLFFLIILGQ